MTTTARQSQIRSAGAAYFAFAAFGSLWGVWGAALPGIRDQASVTDGELGTALLFVGAGALPAMLLVGRATDRFGRRVPAAAVVTLALAGLLMSVTARGHVSLSVGLAILGATSGAADVAINAVAGAAESATGRPVITRSHATFSAAVVVSSLSTGALRHVGAPVSVAFGLVVVVALVAASRLVADPSVIDTATVIRPDDTSGAGATAMTSTPAAGHLRPHWILIAVGLVAALAFAVENAHQSWGAVYLGDVLAVSPGLTAAAPALFATVAALTRFSAGWLSHLPPVSLLLAGGVTAAAGTLIVAVSNTVALALIGLACAAAGTAVLFPTLLSASTRNVDEAVRGRATSTVSAIAYLGFLVGPVYVGRLAHAHGLRTAMVGVAAVAAVFTVAAWPITRVARRTA